LPLSEKARIEAYIPDLPQQTYQNLLDALAQEFTYTFGGATLIRGLDGSYLSRLSVRMQTGFISFTLTRLLLLPKTLRVSPSTQMPCARQLLRR
jgi:hypothetical protein